MTYFWIFITSLIISMISIPILKRLAFKHKIMIDLPNERKIHNRAIPRNGGIGIAIGVFMGILLSVIIYHRTFEFNQLWGFVLGGLFALLIGVYDDLKGLKPKQKLLGEILASLIIILFGIRIESISIPFWQTIQLPLYISIIFTFLWMLLVINALNLIDGLDGLAGGISLIASIALFIILMFNGDGLSAIVAISLVGGCLGFLRYNRYPAKVFMGDSGSMFLGFTLAAISIQTSYKNTTAASMLIPVIILAVPLIDTISAFIRRLIKHKHPFIADKKHIHHRLLNLGLTQRGCTLLLCSICGALGILALVASFLDDNTAAIIITATGMLLVTVSILFFRYTTEQDTNIPKEPPLNRTEDSGKSDVTQQSNKLMNPFADFMRRFMKDEKLAFTRNLLGCDTQLEKKLLGKSQLGIITRELDSHKVEKKYPAKHNIKLSPR